MSNYTSVTEQEGQNATREQLSMMTTRYHLALAHAQGKNVLEVACGSGTGLNLLASVANKVVGGDIDPVLVRKATETTESNAKISVMQLDALALPFHGEQFDLVLMYEAIYYLSDARKFLDQVHKLLRPGGKLIIASVNCEWHGFNPSPFSTKYFSASGFQQLGATSGFGCQIQVGYHDEPKGSSALVALVRKIAVKMHLIPTTMEGKERLKKLFYGKLDAIPSSITSETGAIEPLVAFSSDLNLENYKQLYIICNKN
jgi:SAM-dependent methyltransferase